AERVRGKIEALARPHVDMQIESIDKGILPGNFTLTGVVLKTRPTEADEKPAVIVVDELNLDIGLLSLLAGTASVEFDALVDGGAIEGELAASSDGVELEVSTEQLAMGAMPGLKAVFAGLPVDGKLD